MIKKVKVHMKALIKRTLEFLRLTDSKNNLSLSNLAVMVLIFKIAFAATLDWTAVAGLMLALLNYGHKRHEGKKDERATKEQPKSDTSEFLEAVNKIKEEMKDVKEAAEDAKKKASQIALAAGITAKKVDR